MKKIIRAIAFDFDGVLAESTDIKTQAYARLFEDFDQHVVSQAVEYHLKNEGISRFVKIQAIYKDIIKENLSPENLEALCDRFSELVIGAVVEAPWVEGAREFLELNKDRYLFFIISGTPQDELIAIVQQRGMSHYFSEVLGSPKDKVTLLGEVLPRWKLSSGEVVFIGDAETDWNAARASDIAFLWRRISRQTPLLEGYKGPEMSSLGDLDKHLESLV
jgi:phosphoglycolate phosphatase-like HAD superfamily hydrolase